MSNEKQPGSGNSANAKRRRRAMSIAIAGTKTESSVRSDSKRRAMANTYTQIYLHVVLAVSARVCVIEENRREDLQKYITGIVQRQKQKLIAVYCRPDHTHVLLGFRPDAKLSDFVGDIKTGSTNHINEQRWIGCRFSWQNGYGAFSVSHSHLRRVSDYIHNQERHHRRRSFHDEYAGFLARHALTFDERYVFQAIE